jgi:CRISPR/Cas system-associated exonuclease Cas4 (RecB family)
MSSWSFSRLLVFESCPYRYKLQHLDRVPDLQPKTAADRGTAIHQEAEDYVLGKSDLTHNLRFFKADLTALKEHNAKGRVVCEEEWAFDRNWTPTNWKSGWLRLKCDAVAHLSRSHLAVVDYKTGKRFGNEIKHARQLQLYALCALIRCPEVEQVTCELWYLDQNELASFTMHRKQLKKYLQVFDRDGRAVTDAKTYPPRANIDSCRYCPYSPEKQAQCPHGVTATGRKVIAAPVEFVKPKATKNDKLFDDDLSRFGS